MMSGSVKSVFIALSPDILTSQPETWVSFFKDSVKKEESLGLQLRFGIIADQAVPDSQIFYLMSEYKEFLDKDHYLFGLFPMHSHFSDRRCFIQSEFMIWRRGLCPLVTGGVSDEDKKSISGFFASDLSDPTQSQWTDKVSSGMGFPKAYQSHVILFPSESSAEGREVADYNPFEKLSKFYQTHSRSGIDEFIYVVTKQDHILYRAQECGARIVHAGVELPTRIPHIQRDIEKMLEDLVACKTSRASSEVTADPSTSPESVVPEPVPAPAAASSGSSSVPCFDHLAGEIKSPRITRFSGPIDLKDFLGGPIVFPK